jgi:hypothetical protein
VSINKYIADELADRVIELSKELISLKIKFKQLENENKYLKLLIESIKNYNREIDSL